MDPRALVKVVAKFHLDLAPHTVRNVMQGVKEQLDTRVSKFQDEYGGILLQYTHVKILTDKPLIHPYFPYFHVDVAANALIFRPEPGMRLVGRVNQLGTDFIGVLLLGFYNAVIPARKVREDFNYFAEEEKWVHSKHKKHKFQLDSLVVFVVEEAKNHAGYFQVQGNMLGKDCGALDYLHPNTPLPSKEEDADLSPTSKTMALFRSAGQGVAGPSAPSTSQPDANAGTSSKKDKKRKKEAAEAHQHQHQPQERATPSQRAAAHDALDQKQKKKKEKHEDKDRGADAAAAVPPSAAATPVPAANGPSTSGREALADGGSKSRKKDKQRHDETHRAAAQQGAVPAEDKDKSSKKDKKHKDDKGRAGAAAVLPAAAAAAVAAAAAAAGPSSTPAVSNKRQRDGEAAENRTEHKKSRKDKKEKKDKKDKKAKKDKKEKDKKKQKQAKSGSDSDDSSASD